MPKKEIQEPSLLTHRKEKPLQLVSFDIKKAFDKVGHSVIKQALQAFGLPETIVQALRQSPLVGFARVEINGRKGILMNIPIGSGQGWHSLPPGLRAPQQGPSGKAHGPDVCDQ